jgi:DNA-binding MurR/RpiR family transcriptional regulator
MGKTPAPIDYESLIRLIHNRYDDMSRSHREIATYLTQNPNEVAVRAVNSISQSCGIHASSFVRFAQSLGFDGFKSLQEVFQQRLATAAPGFEARVYALNQELRSRSERPESDLLVDMVVSDAASIQSLLDEVDGRDVARAGEIIGDADTVFLLGQLRSAPVVELIRYLLTMAGKKCTLLDPSGGLATHIARTMGPNDVLFVVSFRFYANEVVSIVEEVASQNRKIIALSDSTLSPLAKSADVLFAVHEHSGPLSRSITAPICLAQAVALATAARVQKSAEIPQIPSVTSKIK